MFKVIKIKNTPKEKIIKEAISVLRSGGLLIYPTETMYGIGVDPTNMDAVNKLLSYKTRREGKPLSIAVSSLAMAKKYVEVNNIALNLYKTFLPGPLTIVSKSLGKVARGVESENKTLGIRIPDYDLVLDIIKAHGRPITATSANASYKKNPYTIKDIMDNISTKQKKLIGLVLDAGKLPKNEASTVVDTTLNQKIILRQGDIKLTKIMESFTNSPEETRELGIKIFEKYKKYLGYKSIIFALEGDLGAGKTEMTKGIAQILGIKENVNSPTFILEKEYKTKAKNKKSKKIINLYHIDTWRMFDSAELVQLDFFNKVKDGNIFAIEWADKVKEIFDKVSADAIIIWVKIRHQDKENKRLITISDFK